MEDCSDDGIDVTTASATATPHVLTQQPGERAPDFDNDDDFADFAQAAPAIEHQVPDQKRPATGSFSDEDNFADFQNATFPTATRDPRVTPHCSATASPPDPPERQSTPPPPPAIIDQKVRSAFILNQNQTTTTTTESDEAIEESSTSVSQVLVGNVIWHRLKKMSAMNSLNKFKWTNSHSFQSFTQALQVDPHLVEKDGIPIFAADLRLLEPMKATQQAPSDMAIKCDAAIPVVIVPEIVSVETQQHSKDNGIVTQPVPESFVNKMSNNNMNLDFLTEQKSNDPRRSSPTHSSSNVSQLEQELLSDLKVPETEASVRSVFEGDKILQTLLSNANISSRPSAAPPPPPPLTLSNGFKSSNGSQLHDMSPASTAEIPDGISSSLASDKRNNPSATCKVLGMSAEAAQILDELPILSFLRSNLT